MTKNDMAKAIAEKTGLTQEHAKEVAQGVFDGDMAPHEEDWYANS